MRNEEEIRDKLKEAREIHRDYVDKGLWSAASDVCDLIKTLEWILGED